LIDGDRIVAVGPGLVAPSDAAVVDATRLLITPGFVNAHLHSWESLYRGSSERLPLELWTLVTYPVVGALPVPPRLVYLRTLVTALDALRGGTTSLLDDVGELPSQTEESLSAVFDGYELAGIRATCTGGIADVAPVDRLPFTEELLSTEQRAMGRVLAPTGADVVEGFLSFCRTAFARHHGRAGGRLRFAIAPSAPQRSSDELLLKAASLAEEHGAVLHMHLLETKLQAVFGTQRYGGTIVQHLAELGLLTAPRLTLAHGIWLTDDDIRLLGESAATIVHNPISNLKLGSGLLPWRALHDAGASIALGTDGTASNDALRMLEVIKQTALLHTLTDPDPATWPSTDEVLWAATRGGAVATGLPERVGALEPGRAADLVVFDLESTTNFTPRNDVARQLVFSENGCSITEVWVAGELVMQNGRSTLIDEAALLEEFRELAEQYHLDNASVREANDAVAPFVEKIYRRASAEPWSPAANSTNGTDDRRER
jgi:5-methylthioadenosine/S-adenosylhomocysteine deaminase